MAGNLPYTFFSNYDLDYKAEVIAAEMVEHGLNADRILILLTGAMKRSFRNDVESVEEEFSEYDHKEYTIVKTTREGIYDMLPEGLFHSPTAHKNANTDKEIIKSIQIRRQEEINARKFFLPFETTINYLRMQMALYENMLDKRSEYDELEKIFSDEWEIFQYLNARQSTIFLHLIPILHNLRDDFDAIKTVMEAMFLLPVKIQLKNKLPYQPSEIIISELGNSVLGTDLTTGNLKYEEGTDEIILTIDCSKNKMFREFIHGGKNEKILQLLCNYLLPVHFDTVIQFELNAADKILRFADEKGFYNSVLGKDTFL